MVHTLSAEELLRLRMGALGLTDGAGRTDAGSDGAEHANGVERIASVARRMLAVQGQDWRSARWALGLRAPGTTTADVHEAFNRGSVVRSWPMRGTIHLLAAEDIGWMQAATNRRVLAGAPKRREFLGMSDAVLERLVEVSLEALRGSAGLDRDELATAWTDAGIEWLGNWRYHLVWWLCQNGHAVFGPVGEGGEPRLVAAEQWISAPRVLSGDEALAELAARYASARGAVTARDFAWWTGLTAVEARRGLAHARDANRLVPVEVATDATVPSAKPLALWADPAMLERSHTTSADGWLLLPAFDEHLLGYQDRAPQLDPEHFGHVLPGKNGMFLATVVHGGRVVGTWRKGTRKAEGLVLTPFPGGSLAEGTGQLERQAAAWAAFHGSGGVSLSFA